MDAIELTKALYLAANWISQVDGLLITAGAGMGVDSGLPDFRGDRGLWQHYPALGQQQMRFADIASPETFLTDPTLAWGFYGHRLQLYRETVPHAGFSLLLQWATHCPQGAFVYTSNVDGQFQKAGFSANRIVECHGSIHYLQCCNYCEGKIWSANQLQVNVDETACRLCSPLPRCPSCGGVARPNILMFGDFQWMDERTELQLLLLQQWRKKVQNLVVIELGAGTAIPSARSAGERQKSKLVRINPREYATSRPDSIGIPMTALAALQAIDDALRADAEHQ